MTTFEALSLLLSFHAAQMAMLAALYYRLGGLVAAVGEHGRRLDKLEARHA